MEERVPLVNGRYFRLHVLAFVYILEPIERESGFGDANQGAPPSYDSVMKGILCKYVDI